MAIAGTGSSANGWTVPIGGWGTGAAGTPTFTAAWVRIPTAAPTSTFFTLYNISSSSVVNAALYTGTALEQKVIGNNGTAGTGTVNFTPDGKWHHFAIRYQSTTKRILYIDGVKQTETDSGTTNAFNLAFLGLGVGPSGASLPIFDSTCAVAELVGVQPGIAAPEQTFLPLLVAGESPLKIGIDCLMYYFPLRNDFQNYISPRVGMSPFGSPGKPVWTDHPPVAPPRLAERMWLFRPSLGTAHSSTALSAAPISAAGASETTRESKATASAPEIAQAVAAAARHSLASATAPEAANSNSKVVRGGSVSAASAQVSSGTPAYVKAGHATGANPGAAGSAGKIAKGATVIALVPATARSGGASARTGSISASLPAVPESFGAVSRKASPTVADFPIAATAAGAGRASRATAAEIPLPAGFAKAARTALSSSASTIVALVGTVKSHLYLGQATLASVLAASGLSFKTRASAASSDTSAAGKAAVSAARTTGANSAITQSGLSFAKIIRTAAATAVDALSVAVAGSNAHIAEVQAFIGPALAALIGAGATRAASGETASPSAAVSKSVTVRAPKGTSGATVTSAAGGSRPHTAGTSSGDAATASGSSGSIRAAFVAARTTVVPSGPAQIVRGTAVIAANTASMFAIGAKTTLHLAQSVAGFVVVSLGSTGATRGGGTVASQTAVSIAKSQAKRAMTAQSVPLSAAASGASRIRGALALAVEAFSPFAGVTIKRAANVASTVAVIIASTISGRASRQPAAAADAQPIAGSLASNARAGLMFGSNTSAARGRPAVVRTALTAAGNTASSLVAAAITHAYGVQAMIGAVSAAVGAVARKHSGGASETQLGATTAEAARSHGASAASGTSQVMHVTPQAAYWTSAKSQDAPAGIPMASIALKSIVALSASTTAAMAALFRGLLRNTDAAAIIFAPDTDTISFGGSSMSGSALTPLPPRWTWLQPNEQKPRNADFTSLLGSKGDLIPQTSDVSVTISRRDGVPMSASDLSQVGDVILDNTNLVVTITLLAGSNADVDYKLVFRVTTAKGNTVLRTAYQYVAQAVG